MGEIQDLFKGMGDTLTKAIASSDEKQPDVKPKDDASAISKEALASILSIAKALNMESDGDVAPLVKKIGELVEASDTHGEVLEKMIERVERLEKGTAVSKSVKGQDDDDDHRKVKKNDSDDEEGVWDPIVKALVKTGSVTLN